MRIQETDDDEDSHTSKTKQSKTIYSKIKVITHKRTTALNNANNMPRIADPKNVTINCQAEFPKILTLLSTVVVEGS